MRVRSRGTAISVVWPPKMKKKLSQAAKDKLLSKVGSSCSIHPPCAPESSAIHRVYCR